MCSLHYLVIVWSAMFLGISYFLYTPIPHGFAEPWRLRSLLAGYKTMGLIASISEKLGYESSINVTRKLLELSLSPGSINDPELQVTNSMFDGIPVRIYKPINIKTPAPALIYFHGGGWVLLSVDSYDLLTRHIAKEADIVVISVEYRLAPEHPFPIPFDDCVTATTHLLQNSEKYGVDSSRVAVGGDSAGGNLAAAVTLKLRDTKHWPKIKTQILVYPTLQMCEWHLPSYEMESLLIKSEDAGIYLKAYANFSDDFLSTISNEQFISREVRENCNSVVDHKLIPPKYIPKGYQPTNSFSSGQTEDFKKAQKVLVNPYIFPLMSKNLMGLPPTLLLSVEKDILRDENAIFVARLKLANIKVIWSHFEYCFHGCFNLVNSPFEFSEGKKMVETVIKYLKTQV